MKVAYKEAISDLAQIAVIYSEFLPIQASISILTDTASKIYGLDKSVVKDDLTIEVSKVLKS